MVGEVVADPGGEIETLAGQVAVTEKSSKLIGERLTKGDKAGRRREREIGFGGVVIEAEVSDGGEKFFVGLEFKESANSDESLNLRIVLEDLLEVVRAAGGDFEITDDGRPIARTEGEGKGRDGVEGREDVALAVHYGPAEGGVEVMFLEDAPGEKLLRLIVAGFGEEALRQAVFDLVGVGQSGAGVEADEIGEIVNAGEVTVSNSGLDGVFVLFGRLALIGRGAIEESFQRGRTKFEGEFAGVARDGLRAHEAC